MTDMVKLGELIQSSGPKVGDDGIHYPVYSVTKHAGFVPSLEYFNKQVFSRDQSGYRLVKQGEFAYATIHLDEGSIGIAPEDALISPMYTVFSVDENRVNKNYLLYLLKSPWAISMYSILGRGAIHRRMAISLKSLGNLQVPLPTLDEQRRIVAILDRADAIRAKRRHMLADYAELRANMFYDVFGVPSRWADLWSKTTIGALTESVQYGTSAKAGADGAWPILRMGNITDDGCLDLTDLKYIDLPETDIPKYTVHAGDMLFNRTNSKEKVGKSCVVDTDWKLALAGYLVRVRFRNPLHAPFVSAFLNSTYGVKLRQRMAKAAVNQANINATEMKNIDVPSPSDTALREFARRVEAITAARAKVERALALDDELFASLQSRAFRGEL